MTQPNPSVALTQHPARGSTLRAARVLLRASLLCIVCAGCTRQSQQEPHQGALTPEPSREAAGREVVTELAPDETTRAPMRQELERGPDPADLLQSAPEHAPLGTAQPPSVGRDAAPRPARASGGRPLPQRQSARKAAEGREWAADETIDLGLSGADGVPLRPARSAEPRRAPAPEALELKRSVLSLPPPTTASDTEGYDAVSDSPFVAVSDAPLSTFSIDVDTASYSNVRRLLGQGQLPPAGAVRIEELINYFPYDYAQPTGEVPFSLTTELAPAPWNPSHRLLHVGLQAKSLPAEALPPSSLVFLIDVSGSMESENKLPLLKRSLLALVETLRERDRIAIVVYAGASGMALPPTSASQFGVIRQSLENLTAGGSTNGAGGLELAYRVAEGMHDPGTSARVILATDGDFNVGPSSQSALLELIERHRQTGVQLSVLGFGMGNYKDATLELLADKGNGNYAYIDTLAEAHKVLVQQAAGTLATLAQDVKLQLEFNPAHVAAYRLLGYENRRLAARDFNDDAKDAGEVGVGHSVTALYELVPSTTEGAARGPESGAAFRADPLRYQTLLPASGLNSELATLKLRYKPAGQPSQTALSRRVEHIVRDGARSVAETTPTFRFSAAVATFGMLLRGSPERGEASFELARHLAAGALGADPQGYRRQFLELIDTAARLTRAPRETQAPVTLAD